MLMTKFNFQVADKKKIYFRTKSTFSLKAERTLIINA